MSFRYSKVDWVGVDNLPVEKNLMGNGSFSAVGATLRGQFASLLEAVRWAPSGDNKNHLSISINGDGVDLFVPSQQQPADIKHQLLQRISLGAAIENIRIRGYRLGLGFHVEASGHLGGGVGGGNDRVILARLRASQVEREPSSERHQLWLDLDAAIVRRQTNRNLWYKGPRLNQAQLIKYKLAVAGVEGAGLRFFDDPGPRRRVRQLLQRAEAARFESRSEHADLMSSIRFDAGAGRSTTEGIPLGALGLFKLEQMMFPVFRSWPIQRFFNVFGFHHVMAWRAVGLPTWLSPHVGAILAGGPQMQAAQSAGQALQRVWLIAESMGLAFQTMASPCLFMHEGVTGPPGELREFLCRGWETLALDNPPFVLFRMGYSPRPKIRAERPLLS